MIKLTQFHRVWILVIMVAPPAMLNFIPINDKFFTRDCRWLVGILTTGWNEHGQGKAWFTGGDRVPYGTRLHRDERVLWRAE